MSNYFHERRLSYLSYIALALLLDVAVAHAIIPTDPEEEKPSPDPETLQKENKLLECSIDVTTNNVFRGISNSDNKPSLQGGLTLNDTWAKTGLYLNVFASSVDQLDARNKTAYLDIDTTAGIANQVGENCNYNIHVVRYNYPNAKGLSYTEGIASVQVYFLTTLVGYSANAYDKGKSGTYGNIGFKYDIPTEWIEIDGINVSGGIGYSKLSRSAGLRSYADYNFQISKSLDLSESIGMIVTLQWTNTNRKSIDAASLKRNHVFGTVALNF